MYRKATVQGTVSDERRHAQEKSVVRSSPTLDARRPRHRTFVRQLTVNQASNEIMPSHSDIFDQQRDDWHTDPQVAFDAWLAKQEFRASSAGVYRAQWGLFLEWLKAKRTNLHSVERPAIEQFVAQLEIRRPQRMRYLRLIERVLDHVREIEWRRRTRLASSRRMAKRHGARRAKTNRPAFSRMANALAGRPSVCADRGCRPDSVGVSVATGRCRRVSGRWRENGGSGSLTVVAIARGRPAYRRRRRIPRLSGKRGSPPSPSHSSTTGSANARRSDSPATCYFPAAPPGARCTRPPCCARSTRSSRHRASLRRGCASKSADAAQHLRSRSVRKWDRP